MSWRSRVRANLESGAYKQKGEDPFTSFAKGFAEVYVPMKAQEQKAKLALQKTAVEKAKEKAEQEAEWKKAAEVLAAEIFPENPTSSAAVTYAYSTIASYEGNVGQATERLESLVADERLEILGPSSMASSSKVAGLMSDFESGSGGYNALLNQSQNNEFSTYVLTDMNMSEVLNFSAPGSEYFDWSKDNVPEGTQAFENGEAATPMGKYQFVGSTLRDIKKNGGFKQLGITDDTLFNEETQDALFTWYANNSLRAAGDSPSAKRSALRGIWEGFKPENVSDTQLDEVISEIETGTFSTGSIQTKPKTKKFNIGEKLADLTYDDDGLVKWQLLKAEVNSEQYDLTPNQISMMERVGVEIKRQIKEKGMFDFDNFLEESRINSSGDALGAMAVVANMDVDKFKGGEKEKTDNYLELKNRLDMFDDRDRSAMLEKAAANGAPLVFYPRSDNGSLKLNPVTVQVQSDGSLKQIGTGTIIDASSGKIVPPEYDASEFIKVYNKPITDVSNIVESGVAGLDNLLQYRKLAMENPAAFNKYLKFLKGATNEIENLVSSIVTVSNKTGEYIDVRTELGNQLEELTGVSRDIFIRQLQAAYDLARMNDSKGQGLSDKELLQNLIAVGQGEDKAIGALRAINVSVDKLVTRTESRRKGMMGSILADDDFKSALNDTRFGGNFNALIKKEFASDPALNEQLNLALSSDTATRNSSNTPPPEPDIPTIDQFNTDLREANPDRTFTDEELLEIFYETFPSQRPE